MRSCLLAPLTVIAQLLQKWLWMRQLNYAGIFWTLLSVKWGMACVAFIGVFLFLWINIRQAARNSFALAEYDTAKKAGSLEKTRGIEIRGFAISRRVVMRTLALIAAAVAAIFAFGFSTQWDTYLRFRYGGSCGFSDPVFGVDVGFYLFTSSVLSAPAGQSRIFDGAGDRWRRFPIRLLRANATQGRSTNRNLGECRSASFHTPFHPGRCRWMGLLPGSVRPFVLHDGRGLWSWIYGGSCDHDRPLDHDRRLGGGLRTSRAQFLPSVLESLGDRSRSPTWRCTFLAFVLVPALFQKFVVQPNELRLETPYLDRYIEFTRKAYKLDAIQETSYPAMEDLTPAAIARNQGTIQNIRLWDARPLLQTYQQTQAIRLYYQFYNVDVDRYHLADGYHQVMLSTRELSAELPAKAQTWVNQNLQFTHGEGVVMNFVSKITPGGFPGVSY